MSSFNIGKLIALILALARKHGGSKLLMQIFFLMTLLPLLTTAPGCEPRQIVISTPQMDIESRFWVRVLLLDNATACVLKTCGSIQDSQLSMGIEQPILSIETKVEVLDGKITISGRPYTGNKLSVCTGEPYIFNLNGDEYRGKLEIVINPDGNSFDVINLIPLEPYLAGVVGAEMPDYWEPEALKAQAIAARTYCLYIKKSFGDKRSWDVTKSQGNQVYLGVKAESAQVWDAINKTYGQVLVCKHPDGTKDIFPTYYCSTCGGHTENSEQVFGDSFEPLVGVECPYCKDVAKPTLFFWPMVKLDKTTITAKLLQRYPKLKQLGEITEIIPAEQKDYVQFSRLTKIKLVGSSGKNDILRAEDFRLTIDPTGRQIQSTICLITKWDDKWAFLAGRGWGHGVGMCQCGAQGLAREGKTVGQILAYYYPGSCIKVIY
jgi:stage II sporulation protein D